MSDKKVKVYNEQGDFLFTIPVYSDTQWGTFKERVANWVAAFISWLRK